MNSRAWLRNVLLSLMALGFAGFGRCGPAEDPWQLAWQDEFDSPLDDSVAAIPFGATQTRMTVRVWSPDADVPVRLKVETAGDPTRSVEAEATVTTAQAWQTLTFDFASQVAGTAALNPSYTYDKISIFVNHGTDGATAGARTYYVDDVTFVAAATPPTAGWPTMTFEPGAVTWGLMPFGGEVATLVVDPTNAANHVVRLEKPLAAGAGAGATFSTSKPPDPTRWRYDVGTGPMGDGWGNGEQEFYTARPENVSQDGKGNLAITARQESYQGMSYTSGRLVTKGLFAKAYGRFEARMKLPVGQGLWPAFWLLGADIDTNFWPACGEIDIMEYRGQEPRRITGSLHGPGYSGANPITASYDLPSASGFDEDFHVFAVEWAPDGITWEVDGVTWQAATPRRMPAGGKWVFDHPFFILLNLAVGGNYVGVVDGTATFPQTLLVDYVRYYER